MAVTSATSTGINVPEIVTGLMEVERAPVTKLEAQIDQKTLVISTLGVFKSKVAALESAAKAIQTPGVFSLRSANSSDSTKVSATATNAASAGSYSVKVAQTAQAAVLSVSGFTATSQVVDLSTFSMTHAGVEYSPDYAKFTGKTSFATGDKINFTLTGGAEQTFTVTTQTTVDQVVSAINTAVSAGTLSGVIARKNAANELQLSSSNAIQGLTAKVTVAAGGAVTNAAVTQEGLSTSTSISSLTELINALDVEVEANLVQIGAGSYSLSLASTATGAANTLALANLSAVTGGGSAAQEVQKISGLTPAEADVYELTLADGSVLTTAALGAAPTLASLVTALQADTDYAASNVVITAGAGADAGKLVLTYKTNSDVGAATLKKTANEAALTSIDGSGSAQEVQKTAAVTVAEGDIFKLTLADGTVLTTAALGAAPTISSLVTALQADADYAASDVVITAGADADDGKLILTYKTNADVAAAVLVRTTSAGTLATTTPGSSGAATYGTLTASTLQSARDAFFSVNGLAVQRASNQVDDVVNGVTFSLNSPVVPAGGAISALSSADFSVASTTTINVTKGAEDLSAAAVEDFVTSYNELVSFYKTESMSSQDPDARGVLNGDSTLRTFMDRIRGLYANGIRLADGSNISFSSIGVEVQRDGTLFLDKGDLNTAIANGLQDKFAQGVTLGYASSSLSLTSFLTSSLRSSGIISAHISDVETQQTRLEDRVEEWEDKLARIEQRYYRQYAALDALLFRLQTTSNALTSAIESLVNSQKNG